jgi:hypothetical protein
MHDQIKATRPSRLGRVESLGPVSTPRTPNASRRARSPSGCRSWRLGGPARPTWAAKASVLLRPNWELSDRDRHVKQRWQALIAEARGLGQLELEHVR